MNHTKIKIEIPESWKWERLEDALDFVIGGDWGKDENFNDPNYDLAYCIRGSEIKNWDIDKGRTASLRKIKLSNIEKRKLVEGDILIEISGGGPEQPVGRTVLVDAKALSYKPEIPKICTNFLRLIRPKNFIDSKFLNLYLKFFYYSGEIVNYQGGSNNLRNLKFPDYIRINFPLPPKTNQQAIVSKIEELFSELDKGIEQLKTAQQQLKIYRQAVLKWAFEGRLTNENVKDGELPKGWKIEILKFVCNIIGGVTKGRDFKGKETIYLPYLRVANVQDGYLDLKEIKKIEVLTTDKEKYKLLVGDILYTEGGDKDKLGRGTIWRGEIKDCIHQNHIFRARPISDNMNSQYISYYSQTKSAKNYFFRNGKQTTNLASINLTILSNLPIPICSINEQIKIVQEIESRLTVADKMEETINQSLKQAEALRQSILKKAFEGKLVATDTIEAVKETAKVIPLERKVLAGKIIHLLHDDKYFGLTKFQKTLYLVENYAAVPYETNFLQDRAGPHDKEFTTAFRKEMQEKDWLQEERKGKITKFTLGDNIGSLIRNYALYFREKGKQIVFVIQQLKDKSTHEAELIATLYAVWNNRLIKKKPVKIDLLVEDFFNWSPKKKEEFQHEEVVSTYKWMKKIEFIPRGFGKAIGID